MAITECIVESHVPEITEAIENAVKNAMSEIGRRAVNNAIDNCPVDTGRLKNSITYKTSEGQSQTTYTADRRDPNLYTVALNCSPAPNEVYIGTNVEYAAKQEGRKNFLKKAAGEEHKEEYANILEKHLNNP